ncbi:MAG: hypothetical protein MUO51_07730 [Woeseiaceae bacterium]|nr:hypothetical protein [Woeseiaceae bacterium]
MKLTPEVIMRLISSDKKNDGFCGEGEYCVQVYTNGAMLVKEFCLDKRANNIADIEAAEELLRTTLTPCDFAALSVTLMSCDGTNDQTILQFDLQQNAGETKPSPAFKGTSRFET